jgi:competence protein ComK
MVYCFLGSDIVLIKEEVMEERFINQKEEYEISPYTFAIIPVEYGYKTYSKIIEYNEEFLIPLKPLDVIKTSCKFFGSSFDGRCEGTKELLNISHKVPIAIDPANDLFFFPTTSPLRDTCVWLSYEHIVSRIRLAPAKTQVNFRNKQSVVISVSYNIIENQMLRTALLKSKLHQKMEETHRQTNHLYSYMQVNDGHSAFQPRGILSEYSRNGFDKH